MAALPIFGVFLLGLFIIIKGGDVLVGSALSLNRVTGINTVIIGATFVSLATTLPEVFVSIFAVSAGNHGIAVGNAIGAMIANIAFVFAISVLFLPRAIGRTDMVFKTIFLVLATVAVFLFALNLEISFLEGIILLAALLVFLASNALGTRRITNPKQECDTADGGRAQTWGWVKIIAGFVAGQFMLCIGAFLLVENGEDLAHFFGISETVVGFTVIALGTSLPELVTAIQSIRHKSGGLAIGNVIGANVINCTLLLGACGIISHIKGMGGLCVSRETVMVALPVLFIMTLVAVLPVMVSKRARRWQGIALLAGYAAYIAYLIIVQPL